MAARPMAACDLDPTTKSLTLHVPSIINPVNNAPAGTNKAANAQEDTAYTVTTADFGFSDVDGNAFSNVKVGTLALNGGTLKLNGTDVIAGQTISTTAIASGQLIYRAPANASGNALGSFTFQVQDDGGTANGGVDLDPSANALTFNVAAVNDAPAAPIAR